MRRSVSTRLIRGAALAASATLLLPGCSTPARPADAALQVRLQLRGHPAANRTIDGFTPPQRGFLEW